MATTSPCASTGNTWPTQRTKAAPNSSGSIAAKTRPNETTSNSIRSRSTFVVCLGYENPTIFEAVVRLNVTAVVASPVKSFGLLTAVVLARHLADERQEQQKDIGKLGQRLNGLRKIAKAKQLRMNMRGLSEEGACKAAINANEILGLDAVRRKASWGK